MTADHVPGSWPRRREAAKRAGVSESALIRYEGKLVHPKRDEHRHRRYDPAELEQLAKHVTRARRAGKMRPATKKATRRAPPSAAPPKPTSEQPPPTRVSGVITRRAFEMFARNETRAQVCIELGEPIENVNWLYENYLEASGTRTPEAAPTRDKTPTTRPPEMRIEAVEPDELARRRPFDVVDLEMLLWDERDASRKRTYEAIRRRVVDERIARGEKGELRDDDLLARPRDSLTVAEEALVEMMEALMEDDARARGR